MRQDAETGTPTLPTPCSNIWRRASASQVSTHQYIPLSSTNSLQRRCADLIYIHRSWFAEALSDSPDPLQHEYGQSVLAVFRSASILINGLRSLARAHPKFVARVWFFWSSFYTSSVRIVLPCSRA